MNGKEIIIGDDTLFNGLGSEEHDSLEAAQVAINYLACRVYNKYVLLPPKTYDSLLQKVKTIQNYELIAYFENFFKRASFIGEQDLLIEEALLSMSKILSLTYPKVIVITENKPVQEKCEGSRRVIPLSLNGLKGYLLAKQDYYDFVYYKYYHRSA